MSGMKPMSDEASCFAGSGLGDADEVAAHQHRGNNALLDRSWLAIAAVSDGTEQFVGKAEVGKRHSESG
jgi:hypothetical protein